MEELVKEGQGAPAAGVSLELASLAGLQLWSAPTRINREDAKEAEKEEARLELRRTIAQNTEVFHLPTAEELEEDEDRVVPPSELRARIEEILSVLADFKNRREPGRSRSLAVGTRSCPSRTRNRREQGGRDLCSWAT